MKKMCSVLLAALLSIGMFVLTPSAQAAGTGAMAGVVVTSSGRLNVRSAQSTSSSVIASLDKGSYVTLISQSGSWWQVEYAKEKYGYCHADYIQTVSGETAIVETQSGNLNVRSGAGTSFAIVDKLAKGRAVLVLSQSNGWSFVLYDGIKTGYVSSQYLGTSRYTPIALNVPDFKQNDSRWANVLIANSGKTIGKIGCTTTAIAMMESYRTGKTIYPDAMSKKLTYTSSGDLYWPSDYQAVLNSTRYLEGIYDQLKQGKPVLFGAKQSSGGQHWVVITGFTGGDTLTASRFTIHDPDSHQRTNLQHLLNEYPVFYKYFYYK